MQPYGAWPPPGQPPKSTGNAAIVIVATVVALLFVGLAFVLAGAWLYAKRNSRATYSSHSTSTTTSTTSGSPGGWTDAMSPIPVTSADPNWGEREAPVTIVFFSDFEDPFAPRSAPAIDTIEKIYGPSVVRIVWKNNPQSWHVHAHDAAEASYGCFDLKGSDAFWHFEERAFANQKSLDEASFETWAGESAVDLVKFRDGMTTHKWAAKVDEDAKLAKSLRVYTGQAFINGIKIYSSSMLASWQKEIDDELPKARAALAGGVSGDQIYVTRSTVNFAAAPTAPTSTYVAPTTAGTVVYRVPVGSSPVRGPNDALVTIVEFADFQCPFCKRLETTLEALRAKYGSDLRIVWKNEPLPFHPRALPAAELAFEARAEKGEATFWLVHDELYRSSPTLDDATLASIATRFGVDTTKVRTAIAANKYQTIIDADHTLGKGAGVSGTPNCFVNGRQLTGSQPQSVFETAIDEELK
ncbi:MAG TPA: thioredoxin domain-containing protein, partial [Polyangiaceae bacterium]